MSLRDDHVAAGHDVEITAAEVAARHVDDRCARSTAPPAVDDDAAAAGQPATLHRQQPGHQHVARGREELDHARRRPRSLVLRQTMSPATMMPVAASSDDAAGDQVGRHVDPAAGGPAGLERDAARRYEQDVRPARAAAAGDARSGRRRIGPAEIVVAPAPSVTRAAAPNCSARLPRSMVDPAVHRDRRVHDAGIAARLAQVVGARRQHAATRGPAWRAAPATPPRTVHWRMSASAASLSRPRARRATSRTCLTATMAASLRIALDAGAASNRVRPLRHSGRRRAPACGAVRRRARKLQFPAAPTCPYCGSATIDSDFGRTARDAAALHRRRARVRRATAAPCPSASASSSSTAPALAGHRAPHRGRPRAPASGLAVRARRSSRCAPTTTAPASSPTPSHPRRTA